MNEAAIKEEQFTHFYLPVNLERIIQTLKINKKINSHDLCNLNPIEVVKKIKELVAFI